MPSPSPLLTRIYNIMAGAWRQRYVIVLPIFILPLIGILASTMSTPRYKSHMSFLVQESGKDNPYLTDLSVETNLKDRMSGLKTLLHSRHILTRVVEELKNPEETLSEEAMEYRIGLLSDTINITLIGSNLISIAMRSNNPKDMKNTLGVISKHFIDSLLAPAQSSISSTEEFLSRELKLLEVSLGDSEEKMAQFKLEHADELPQTYQANSEKLRETQDSLEEKTMLLAGAREVMKNLQSKVLELDPVLAELESNLVKLKGELAMKRAKYTDKHSAVRAVLRQIKRLEEERQRLFTQDTVSTDDIERFWSTQQSASSEQGTSELLMSQIHGLQQEQQSIRRLEQEVVQLKKNILVLGKRVRSFGKNEKKLRELQREITVKSSVYEDLLERHEKALITRSLGDFEAKDRIKIIDKPFNPISPLNLPLIVFIIGGLFGGIFTGISFAIINELMNHKLYTVEQIEKLSRVPVIARLPRFNADQDGLDQVVTT